MDMTTDLMGLKLKNPLLTAAGPWAGNAAGIQRCIDAGAGAVITETISLEARQRISPRLFAQSQSLFNTMLYSNLHLEEWEDEFRVIDRKDAKLICSIWGATASEIAYLARKVEHMGADGIEISISAPIGSRNQFLTRHSSHIQHFASAAVEAVDIPIMVKLSYEAASLPEFSWDLKKAGVKAISAIDALKGLLGVDIENKRTLMPTYGGYTGPHIRPVSLATTAALHQYTPLQVVSSGGVVGYQSVIEFLMLGATAVQLASAILCNGYEVISEVISGLEAWMADHDLDKIDQIRGSALPSLGAYEDIVPVRLGAVVLEACHRQDCLRCVDSCLPEAIYLDAQGGITIKTDLCDGCGLCIAHCPQQILHLEW